MKHTFVFAMIMAMMINQTSAQFFPIKLFQPKPKDRQYHDTDHDLKGNVLDWKNHVKGSPKYATDYVADSTDCDDNNSLISTPTLFFIDADSDGYGGSDFGFVCLANPPPGYSSLETDCDDLNPKVNPESAEVCNGIDDNCSPDHAIDEGLTMHWYFPAPYGGKYAKDSTNYILSCSDTPPAYYVDSVAKPILILTATGHHINMGLHCLSWEDGSLSVNNLYQNPNREPIIGRLKALHPYAFSYPGIAQSHYAGAVIGDTILYGGACYGYGCNPCLTSWNPLTYCNGAGKYQQGGGVGNGICAQSELPSLFADFIQNVITPLGCKIIMVENLHDTYPAIKWRNDYILKRLGKGSLFCTIESGECGNTGLYDNATLTPTAGAYKHITDDNFDNFKRDNPDVPTIADFSPIEMITNWATKWNIGILGTHADGGRQYIIDKHLLPFIPKSSATWIDSLNKAVFVTLPDRIAGFKKTFPGYKEAILEAGVDGGPEKLYWRGTTTGGLYYFNYEMQLNYLDVANPDLITLNLYYRAASLGLGDAVPNQQYFALLQLAGLYVEGSEIYSVSSSLPGVFGIASKHPDGSITLDLSNTSDSDYPIPAVSINGVISKPDITGDVYSYTTLTDGAYVKSTVSDILPARCMASFKVK